MGCEVSARQTTGTTGFSISVFIGRRNLLGTQARKAASVLSEVKKLYVEIHSDAADLDRREDALKAKEVHRRQQELKAVRSQMDDVIKNFEFQLQNANTDQFGSILREAEAAFSTIAAAHSPSGDMLNQADDSKPYIPKLGEKVYVKGLGGKLADVVEVAAQDDSVMVQFGKIKARVNISNIWPMQSDMKYASNGSAPNVKWQGQVIFKTRPLTKEQKVEEPTSYGPAVRISKNTVDLRGLLVEEASRNLQIAILGCRSYGVLSVIHGMGMGVVKERVLDILRNHPRVARFEEESP